MQAEGNNSNVRALFGARDWKQGQSSGNSLPKSGSPQYDPTMNPVSREELDARLNEQRAVLDSKLSDYKSTLGGMVANVERAVLGFEMTAALTGQKIDHVSDELNTLKSANTEIVSEMKNLKWWMIGTGISVVMGIASFNATVLSNMVASFESGKNTAQSLAQTQAEQKAQSERLDQIAKSVQETQALLAQSAKKESSK